MNTYIYTHTFRSLEMAAVDITLCMHWKGSVLDVRGDFLTTGNYLIDQMNRSNIIL